MLRKDHAKRVLLALAALRLRGEELEDFLEIANGLGPRRLYDLLRRIEHDAFIYEASIYEASGNDRLHKEARFRSASSYEVVHRVLDLLRNEARLSNDGIVQGLMNRLSVTNTSKQLPRYIPKKSLSDWLVAVNERVGPSQLLQAATALRNQRVHEPKSAWPIDNPND